jgi:hypothetical protein
VTYDERVELFFELLERRGLKPEGLQTRIRGWNTRTLNRFLEEVRELLPDAVPSRQGTFSFLASSPLAGAPQPCAHIDCRMLHIDRLSRFAVLYADEVLIHTRLHDYPTVPQHALAVARDHVVDDLMVLQPIRPLLSAGLIRISRPKRAFCALHAPPILKDGKLERLRAELQLAFSQNISATYNPVDRFIHVQGPATLLEHPFFRPLDPNRSIDLTGERDASRREIVGGETLRNIVDDLTHSVLDDSVQHSVVSAWYGIHYLTNRSIDFTVLQAANSPDQQSFTRAVAEGFTHALPTLEVVNLDQLLKLRRAEGESFRVYRDALSRVLRDLRPADEHHIRQAFEDVIRPELNKIDLVVRNERHRIARSLKTNVILGAGVVSVGLSAGLFAPDAGKLLAELGGFGFALGALNKLNQLFEEPALIRENNFYFLWRATRTEV